MYVIDSKTKVSQLPKGYPLSWDYKFPKLEWNNNMPENPDMVPTDALFVWILPSRQSNNDYYTGASGVGLVARSNKEIAGSLSIQQFHTTITYVEGLFDQNNTTDPLTSYGYENYSHTGSLFRKEQELVVEANIQCYNQETFSFQQQIIQRLCIPRKEVSTLFIKYKGYFNNNIVYTKAYLTSKEVDFDKHNQAIDISFKFLLPEPIYLSNRQSYYELKIVPKREQIDMMFPVKLPFTLQSEREGDKAEFEAFFGSSIKYPLSVMIGGFVSRPVIRNLTTGKQCVYNDIIKTDEWIEIDNYYQRINTIETRFDDKQAPLTYGKEIPLTVLGYGTDFTNAEPMSLIPDPDKGLGYKNTFAINANFPSADQSLTGQAYIRYPAQLWF